MKVPCLRGFVVCCANSYWLSIRTYGMIPYVPQRGGYRAYEYIPSRTVHLNLWPGPSFL